MSFTIPYIPGTTQEWGLTGNAVAFPSPFTGTTKVLRRPGSRWNCSVTWPPYRQGQNSIGKSNAGWRMLDAFLAETAPGESVYIPDVLARDNVGSTFAPSLIQNGYFTEGSDGLDGWTPSANIQSIVDNGWCRLTTEASSGIVTLRQSFATDLTSYSVVMDIRPGTSGGRVRVGTTGGGAELLNVIVTEPGRQVHTFTATSATTHISLVCEGDEGNFVFYKGIQVARCGVIFTGGEDGSQIRVKFLPQGMDKIALAGHKIEVNGELKLLTQDLSTYTVNTAGFAVITPPMRQPVPVDTPVIFHRPCGKFIVPDFSYSRSDRVGGVSSFSQNFTEIF